VSNVRGICVPGVNEMKYVLVRVGAIALDNVVVEAAVIRDTTCTLTATRGR
jgi:hypothetical protein